MTNILSTSTQEKGRSLRRFDFANEAIATMRSAYMDLRLRSVEDKETLVRVHEARMDVKAKRVNVEKVRVELKAEALEWGRTVDAEAKRITALLEPIEAHLAEQENAVAEHRARLKAEAEAVATAKRKAKLDQRMARLAEIGYHAQPSVVESLSDADFELTWEAQRSAARKAELERAQAAEAAEAARKQEARQQEATQAAQAAERARLKAERDELERVKREAAAAAEQERKRLEAERAELEASRKCLEAEQRAAQRKRYEEAALIEAEEARAAHERRQAELRPHAEKLEAFAQAFLAAPRPNTPFTEELDAILEGAAREIRHLCNGDT